MFRYLSCALLVAIAGAPSVGQVARQPPIHLNHVYVVLDAETFADVRDSEFLRKRVAAVDEGLPDFAATTGKSKRIYLRGQHTYLELLGPDNRFGDPVGKVGIGLCVERSGALKSVRKTLDSVGIKTADSSLQLRAGTPEAVDWFRAVFVKSPGTDSLVWWISETHPDFLKGLYPDNPGVHGSIARASFLEPVFDRGRWMRDICTVRLRVPESALETLAKGLTALGWQQSRDGGEVCLEGPDLILTLERRPASDPVKLVSLEFSANESAEIGEAVVSPRFAVASTASGRGSIWFAHANGIRRHRGSVRREDCFPLETLPPNARKRSEDLLLDALDSEALYSMVGGIKPVSEGFFSTYFQVDPPDTEELGRVRKAVSVWRCGDQYETGVLVFENLRDGQRYASAWVANRPKLREVLRERHGYFGRLGIAPHASADVVLLSVERSASPAERWRGFGNVFGYPQPAIDFFVRAGMHQATTGEFVKRDFRHFPTHARARGGFVYAVPPLTPESPDEALLRRKVDTILKSYRSHRSRHITQDDRDVVSLVREWFDDGSGWCHPDHAAQKADLRGRAP